MSERRRTCKSRVIDLGGRGQPPVNRRLYLEVLKRERGKDWSV